MQVLGWVCMCNYKQIKGLCCILGAGWKCLSG